MYVQISQKPSPQTVDRAAAQCSANRCAGYSSAWGTLLDGASTDQNRFETFLELGDPDGSGPDGKVNNDGLIDNAIEDGKAEVKRNLQITEPEDASRYGDASLPTNPAFSFPAIGFMETARAPISKADKNDASRAELARPIEAPAAAAPKALVRLTVDPARRSIEPLADSEDYLPSTALTVEGSGEAEPTSDVTRLPVETALVSGEISEHSPADLGRPSFWGRPSNVAGANEMPTAVALPTKILNSEDGDKGVFTSHASLPPIMGRAPFAEPVIAPQPAPNFSGQRLGRIGAGAQDRGGDVTPRTGTLPADDVPNVIVRRVEPWGMGQTDVERETHVVDSVPAGRSLEVSFGAKFHHFVAGVSGVVFIDKVPDPNGGPRTEGEPHLSIVPRSGPATTREPIEQPPQFDVGKTETASARQVQMEADGYSRSVIRSLPPTNPAAADGRRSDTAENVAPLLAGSGRPDAAEVAKGKDLLPVGQSQLAHDALASAARPPVSSKRADVANSDGPSAVSAVSAAPVEAARGDGHGQTSAIAGTGPQAQSHNHTSLPSPMAQLARHAAAADSNERTVELKLSPAELGPVRMTFSGGDTGAISVAIHASRADTLDLLRNNVHLLGQEFRDLGFAAANFSFGQWSQDRPGPSEPSWAQDIAEMPLPVVVAIAPLRLVAPAEGLDLRI